MKVRPEDIDYKKKIGTLKGRSVFEIATKGGYHIVCSPNANGTTVDYLGVGPHRAVARFIAKKTHAGLNITELSKSDHVDPSHFQRVLPHWEGITETLQAMALSA